MSNKGKEPASPGPSRHQVATPDHSRPDNNPGPGPTPPHSQPPSPETAAAPGRNHTLRHKTRYSVTAATATATTRTTPPTSPTKSPVTSPSSPGRSPHQPENREPGPGWTCCRCGRTTSLRFLDCGNGACPRRLERPRGAHLRCSACVVNRRPSAWRRLSSFLSSPSRGEGWC